MPVRPASRPAITHTSVDSRRTGMPSSRARSELSATERTATPASVRRRNQPMATSTTGTTMAISRSFPLKSTGKSSTWWALRGVVTPPTMEGPRNQPGTSSWIPPKSWARPMVTTMTISRGAEKKRQRMMKSTKRPEGGADQEGDPDADEPVDVVGQVELDGDRGRQRAHGAVGEVDDPRGAVGQHQAEGQQAVDGAELRPVEDLPPRRRVRPQRRDGEEQDEGSGQGQADAAQAGGRGRPGAADRERGGDRHGAASPRPTARSGSSRARAARRRRTSRSSSGWSRRRRRPPCRRRATSCWGPSR